MVSGTLRIFVALFYAYITVDLVDLNLLMFDEYPSVERDHMPVPQLFRQYRG